MSEINTTFLKNAVVQKGKYKGIIKNPLTAQEEANTILELIGRATSAGYKIDSKAKQALDTHATDYVLTAQAEKTVQSEKNALVDSLTGALNRRGIIEAATRTKRTVDREGGAFQVAFMDLRHFKAINDTYGHEVGDTALKAIVTALKDHTRPDYAIGRWGGEEFVLVMKGSNPNTVHEISDRMHKALSSLETPFNSLHADTGYTVYDNSSSGVTVEDLVHRADQAMYFAKKNNLSRVQPWNESMASIEVPK